MFEGFESVAYPDPATGNEPWTIGYGTTRYPDGRKVRKGDTCTVEQAEACLRDYLSKIDLKIPHTLSDNQWAALNSWIYNLGIGNWVHSTLRRKIIANPDDPTIAAEFLKWDKAGGRVMAGLTRRRKAEAALWSHSS